MRYLVTVVGVAFLAGCANIQQIEQAAKAQEQKIKQIRHNVRFQEHPVRIVDTPRIVGDPVRLSASKPAPKFLKKPVTFVSHGGMSLVDILRAISDMTGVRMRYTENANETTDGAQSDNKSPIEHQAVRYSGPLRGLLDLLAERLDVTWRYNDKDDRIEFYRFETKVLALMLPNGSKDVSSSISLASGESESSGSVSVSHKMTIDPWSSIMESVRLVLDDGAANQSGGDGSGSAGDSTSQLSVKGRNGMAVASRDLGLITVIARPQYLRRVESLIDNLNAQFSRNIVIDVRVLELRLDDDTVVGVSASFLRNHLNRYGINIVGAPNLTNQAGVVSTATLSWTRTKGNKNSSLTAVIDALRQIGSVSLTTEQQVIAVNGQPAPFQAAREIAYLASSETTTTPNVGTTTTLTPGQKTVGFTANFLPLLMPDGRIFLQYQIESSALISLDQFSSNGSMVQLPNISKQAIQQQAFLRNGQAIMLFGFSQDRNSANKRFGVLNASQNGQNGQSMTVILIQARSA